MTATAAEQAAMTRALELAATPGVPLGPNPRVGCVLLDGDRIVAEGWHRGAGTPHAEVDALAHVADAHGLTAVVTLEPCNHTGRTGPCVQALHEAGIARVVYAEPDPNPIAAGGAQALRAVGIEMELLPAQQDVNRFWRYGLEHGRPFVTWKFASTLDGRSAAADGSSRWVSSSAARLDSHRLRATADVMLVGTNTVAVDDPRLTVRDERGLDLPQQPLRAVMGVRELAPDRQVFHDAAQTLLLRTRDPREALTELFERGRRHVFLEGGPTLAAAFLKAGLIDEVVAYLAPTLLGAGRSAVGDLGITTIAEALRFRLVEAVVLDGNADEPANVRLLLHPPTHPNTQEN